MPWSKIRTLSWGRIRCVFFEEITMVLFGSFYSKFLRITRADWVSKEVKISSRR